MFLERLKFIDLFAPEIKLNIEGKRRLQTYTGAVFTVAYLVLLILATSYISKNYMRKEKPISLFEPSVAGEYPRVDLRKNGLVPIIFGYYDDTNVIEAKHLPRYVTVQAVKQSWVTQEIDGRLEEHLFQEHIKTAPCSELTESQKKHYDYINPSNYLYETMGSIGYCVADDDNLFVAGKGTDKVFVQFVVKIKPCILGPECVSADKLSTFNMAVALPQTSLNFSSLENPYRQTLGADTFFYITPKITQLYNSRLQFNEVNDYVGLLPDWEKRADFFDIKDTIFNVGYRDAALITCTEATVSSPTDCPSYLEFKIQSSGYVNSFNRRYKTLSETFGEIGGVNGALLLGFTLIYMVYSWSTRDKLVLKRVYGKLLNNKSLSDIIEGQTTQKVSSKGFCQKKSKEEQQTEEAAQQVITDCLDIVSLVRELSYVKILSNCLLEDHHRSPDVARNRIRHRKKFVSSHTP